jgi:transcriptional regulator with XRE-family HTH domain
MPKNVPHQTPHNKSWSSAKGHAAAVDAAIGQRMRARRKELKMTDVDLAKAINMGRLQINKYERGFNRIPAVTLLNLATALSVDIRYFFEGVYNPTQRLLEAAPDAAELLAILNRLPNPEHRALLLECAEILAEAN